MPQQIVGTYPTNINEELSKTQETAKWTTVGPLASFKQVETVVTREKVERSTRT